MNLDELKSAWKCQDTKDHSNLDQGQLQLLALLRLERKALNSGFLITDIFIAVVLVSSLTYIFASACTLPIVWPLYLGTALGLGAVLFHPWRNHRRRKREQRFGDTLRDELLKKRGQLDHQIRFDRWSSIWGYYLPIIGGLALTYWQSYLNGNITLSEFHGAALFHILVLGLLGYFAGGLGIASARRQIAEVDRELAALDVDVVTEEVPRCHRFFRKLMVAGTLLLCAYLVFRLLVPLPRAGSPVAVAGQEAQFAKVAPYTGVRWEPNATQPLVEVRGEWMRLVSIDGIPVEDLMQTARERFAGKARKRFAEDLPELLVAAGHSPAWSVTLMLDRGDGSGPQPFKEEMSEAKRRAARAFFMATE